MYKIFRIYNEKFKETVKVKISDPARQLGQDGRTVPIYSTCPYLSLSRAGQLTHPFPTNLLTTVCKLCIRNNVAGRGFPSVDKLYSWQYTMGMLTLAANTSVSQAVPPPAPPSWVATDHCVHIHTNTLGDAERRLYWSMLYEIVGETQYDRGCKCVCVLCVCQYE